MKQIDRDETGYVVRGDTFPLRHTLRALGLEWDGSTGTYYTEHRETWEHAVSVLGATPQHGALGVTVRVKAKGEFKVYPIGYVRPLTPRDATHVACVGCYTIMEGTPLNASVYERIMERCYCDAPPGFYELREASDDQSFSIESS
jgi:hypothetical protein